MHLSGVVLARSAIALTGALTQPRRRFDPSALPEESTAPPTAADPAAVLEDRRRRRSTPDPRPCTALRAFPREWGPEWDATGPRPIHQAWVQRQAVEALSRASGRCCAGTPASRLSRSPTGTRQPAR